MSRRAPDEPVVTDDRRAAWRVKMARVAAGVGLALTLVLLATVGTLGPTRQEVAVLSVLAAVNAVVLGGLVWLVPWHRVDERLLLVFPLVGLVDMALLGWLTDGIAPHYLSLTVTAFLFAGVTQRPWTSLWLVPVGLPAWLVMDGGLAAEVWVRALTAVLVWVLVAEITARRTSSVDTALEEMEDIAARDPLTGLLNRRSMRSRLSQLRVGDVLLLLDLDHFKRINDTRGHQAGDALLASLGRLLLGASREQDSVIRYGGEEVLILLPGSGLDGARRFDARLRNAFFVAHPGTTYSAGLAVLANQESAAEAFRRADEALYTAKAQGRNRTVLSAPPAAAGPRRRNGDGLL